MVFSESLEVIAGGRCVRYDAKGERAEDEDGFGRTLLYFRQKPPYSTIAGGVFVQGGLVGRASYHFDQLPRAERAEGAEGGDGSCYLSYAAAPRQWQLDDGSRPPERKPFVDASYDAASRTFRGTIDWRPRTFGNGSRWEYTMVFDPLFLEIAGGEVVIYNADGAETTRHRFGADLRYARYEDAFEEMGMAMLRHRRREGEELQVPEPGPFQLSFAALRLQEVREPLFADGWSEGSLSSDEYE